jgi:uncharacterized membrane protein (DUF4010 family)
MQLCRLLFGGRLLRGVAFYQVVQAATLVLFVLASGANDVNTLGILIALAGVCSNSCDMLLSGTVKQRVAWHVTHLFMRGVAIGCLPWCRLSF